MDKLLWAVVIVILIILFYNFYFKYSAWNTYGVRLCDQNKPRDCESYYVHREHSDQKEAAKILEEVTNRSKSLISHLVGKYGGSNYYGGVDPDKNNRIDVIGGTELYRGDDVMEGLHSTLTPEYVQERVTQLMNNYDSDKIYEISPLNKEGNTSYTEDKARLVLCLREKEKNMDGEHDLHDINTIMFVVLHELSHMMNREWGHPSTRLNIVVCY
jgi:hypothetical protein